MAPQSDSIPKLGSNLDNEFVAIYVGPKRKVFTVHKGVICESVDFFKAAFTGGFKEGQRGELYMPEDSTGAFSLYVDWIYRGKISEGHSRSYFEDLYNPYFLAEERCLARFKDVVMDSIQDMAQKYNLTDELFTKSLLLQVMDKTPKALAGLRVFCADAMASVHLMRSRLFPEDNKEYLFGDNGKGNVKEKDDCYPINNKDLKFVWGACGSNFDFFKAYMYCLFKRYELRYEIEDGVEFESDFRMRNEDDPSDRCFFHTHRIGDSSRALSLAPDFPSWTTSQRGTRKESKGKDRQASNVQVDG